MKYSTSRSGMKLSKEEYQALEGRKCPFCLSPNIFPNGHLHVEMVCLHCGNPWLNTYKLEGYELEGEEELWKGGQHGVQV